MDEGLLLGLLNTTPVMDGVQHDELAAGWRARHVVMVERMIGTKTGTGGSSGAEYLRSRLPVQYYPLLWGLRSHL